MIYDFKISCAFVLLYEIFIEHKPWSDPIKIGKNKLFFRTILFNHVLCYSHKQQSLNFLCKKNIASLR